MNIICKYAESCDEQRVRLETAAARKKRKHFEKKFKKNTKMCVTGARGEKLLLMGI
jgi:hypothetical protein